MKIYRILRELITGLALSAFLLIACNNAKQEYLEVKIDKYAFSGEDQSIDLNIRSNTEWSVDINDMNGAPANWIKASEPIGSGNLIIKLKMSENTEARPRKSVVMIHTASSSVPYSFTILQDFKKKAFSPSDDSGSSDSNNASNPNTGSGSSDSNADVNLSAANVPHWLELPATNDSRYKFYFHKVPYRGKSYRNYSYFYDKDRYTSLWVAYPLCRMYTGQGKRTNAWGHFDPNLPYRQQQDMGRGYRGRSLSGGRYDRGHQLPSADRTFTREANEQTFYGTNMTPQDADLNQGLWKILEEKVRTWSNKSDTLYVVTGCILDGYTETAIDASGKRVPVPVAYYKAILRYAKSSTVGFGGYTGIAFYFDHFTNSSYRSMRLKSSMAMSIDELERKIGMKLFVNLSDKIGAERTKKVKTQNPKNVSWWALKNY